MTGARRRLTRLEAQHGTGRAEWYDLATDGQRAALRAVAQKGGSGEAVRGVFDAFRATYAVGMTEAQRQAAADQALENLRDVMPRDAFTLTLAYLQFGPS